RTHLMDATPIRLGQEFSGYAQQVAYAKVRAQKSIEALRELALGGTAVGTGLNRHLDLPRKMLRHLEQRTGIAFYEAKNHFEAQGTKDAVVEASRVLANVVDIFCDKCVRGILANEARCRELVELSMAMVTSLTPKIGYDRAAEIAKESAKTGRTVREIAREKKVLPEKELER